LVLTLTAWGLLFLPGGDSASAVVCVNPWYLPVSSAWYGNIGKPDVYWGAGYLAGCWNSKRYFNHGPGIATAQVAVSTVPTQSGGILCNYINVQVISGSLTAGPTSTGWPGGSAASSDIGGNVLSAYFTGVTPLGSSTILAVWGGSTCGSL
jgi:hypothetical protein